MTDESIIGEWWKGYRVLFTDNHIIFFDDSTKGKILLFKKNGEFVRTIGKKGQGPGEYTAISDVAINIKKQLIYVITLPKILCYDLEGNFIKEKSLLLFIESASFLMNELAFLETKTIKDEDNGYNHQTLFLKANEDLEITDSLLIQNKPSRLRTIYSSTIKDYFTIANNNMYLYFPNKSTPCDTLFKMANGELIPSVEVKFDTQDPISARDIFKTSRFVIVTYGRNSYFGYDIHLDKKYNMEVGIMDDMYTNSTVNIRPNPSNGNLFYYLHENISNEGEELNPILYIGEFKK